MAKLRDTLRNPEGIFRVGTVWVDTCVVGRMADGEWTGWKTKLIET